MRFTSRLLEAGERRVDGRDKVSGRTKYTADYTRAGMLWAAFVASPYPRARIVAIDAAAARAMAGVRAVLTGADIGPRYFGFTLKDWPVLAYERVNFVGEYVVAVAADTRAIAEAAAATIAVTYEELPAMLDPAAAIADGAEPVHPNDATFVYNARLRSRAQRRSGSRLRACRARFRAHVPHAALSRRLPRTARDAGLDRVRRNRARDVLEPQPAAAARPYRADVRPRQGAGRDRTELHRR
jgi:CO/xanthine dehydrogenase Mo-binding subunit